MQTGFRRPLRSWHSTAELHTVMESVAITLALVVAAAAPFRYYSERDSKFLFLGTGFFATALLDGYHTVVTGTAFRDYFPSPPESLTAWSWTASRTFLAVLMVISLRASQRPQASHIRAIVERCQGGCVEDSGALHAARQGHCRTRRPSGSG